MKRRRIVLILFFATIIVLSFLFKVYELQHKTNSVTPTSGPVRGSWLSFKLLPEKDVPKTCLRTDWREKEQEIKGVLTRLDQRMPTLSFTHISTTTSAAKSRVTLLNPKNSYCVGDHLMVRLDLYNHLGQRKEYGGDFLRVRIHSPQLRAGASGHIEDYGNGTYLVDFTLFWEGIASVSLLLIHPSEGVSALWAARKKGFEKIAFTGQFLNGTKTVITPCGFHMYSRRDLCEYREEHEVFFCVKPKNVPCGAFVRLTSRNRPISYLTTLELDLLQRSNIGIEIPQNMGDIHIALCEGSQKKLSRSITGQCRVGLGVPPTPSGYVLQNMWHPQFCSIATGSFRTQNLIYACLQKKLIYLMGDSTLRQWIYFLTRKISTLKFFDFHDYGAFKTHMAIDQERYTFIQWTRHGFPIVNNREFYSVKTSRHIARAIDEVPGDAATAVVIGMGQHFRPFPIDLFVRRMVDVRRAIGRLLLRSPDTKVIINLENVREMLGETERFANFHGYAQYLAMKDIFKDMAVGILDSWDMSVAYNLNKLHPEDNMIWNQIVMFLTYLC